MIVSHPRGLGSEDPVMDTRIGGLVRLSAPLQKGQSAPVDADMVGHRGLEPRTIQL